MEVHGRHEAESENSADSAEKKQAKTTTGIGCPCMTNTWITPNSNETRVPAK